MALAFKKAQNPLGTGRKEEWKEISEFPGYHISNMGRVRTSKQGQVFNYLKEFTTRFGYMSVQLYKNGKATKQQIHRLVAKEFVPNANTSRTMVNHKDCCKTNNKVTNLEWVTRDENADHARRAGRYLHCTGDNHWTHRHPERKKAGELNGRAKLTKSEVMAIRSDKLKTITELAKQYKVTKTTISFILKRKLWKHI